MLAHEISAATLAQFSLAQPPSGFVDNPYPWYAALREHAPVHWLGAQSVLLTRHEDVAQIYREPGVSSDKRREFGPKFGDSPLFEHHTTSLVFNDAPLHTRVRRLMLGAVNQRAIARMEAGVAELVETLLDSLVSKATPDLIDDFAALIPVEVIGNLLGVPRGERGPLRAWSLAILSALEPAPSAVVLHLGNQAVTEFMAYLRGLVAVRRVEPRDPDEDVLTRLIQGELEGERLTEAELLHNCIFLLNAGHETTTNLLGNGLHALLRQRDQWDRLSADASLLPLAVEELLRFESPLQLNNRLTTQAVTVAGQILPPGCFITLAIGAANRDPSVFASPDVIDVGRKPNPHLAFGHGAHACAGMNVARLEARLALAGVLRRFPGMALAGAPQRDQRVRFRGFRHVPVTLGAPR